MRKYLVVKKNKTILLVIIIFILIISTTNSALGNSLITTIRIPEGIVMASDSRQSLSLNEEITTIVTDTATKLFLLEKYKIGISTCGQSFLNNISISSHIKNFIEKELTDDDDIITVANKLFEYIKNISVFNEDISFHVAGYKKENKVSVPYVYLLNTKDNLIKRANIDSDNKINYGMSWSGQIDILECILKSVTILDEKGNEQIIKKVAPIIWEAMTLQDAIDFSIYAIRTTIDTMRFQARPKTVGGPIDVLLISPEEAKFIQKKELHGEIIKQE
jgi:hypothetical protein